MSWLTHIHFSLMYFPLSVVAPCLTVDWPENKWYFVVFCASSVSAESRDYVHAVINSWEVLRRKVSLLMEARANVNLRKLVE